MYIPTLLYAVFTVLNSLLSSANTSPSFLNSGYSGEFILVGLCHAVQPRPLLPAAHADRSLQDRGDALLLQRQGHQGARLHSPWSPEWSQWGGATVQESRPRPTPTTRQQWLFPRGQFSQPLRLPPPGPGLFSRNMGPISVLDFALGQGEKRNGDVDGFFLLMEFFFICFSSLSYSLQAMPASRQTICFHSGRSKIVMVFSWLFRGILSSTLLRVKIIEPFFMGREEKKW